MESTKNNQNGASLIGQSTTTDSWLSSQDARRELKISSCELMHRRLAGDLIFKKVGKAYFYKLPRSVL